jgi:hypothetical protein
MARMTGTDLIRAPLTRPMRSLSAHDVFGWVPSLGRAVAGLLMLLAAAWITHVVVCFKSGAWGFLVAGAVVFPLAIAHGISVWLSATPRDDVCALRSGPAA